MFIKAYDIKKDEFVYSFGEYDDYLKRLCSMHRLFCPYCDYTDECNGISYVKEHPREGNIVRSHFRRNKTCIYEGTLPKATEGESAEHRNLKTKVGLFLESQDYKVDYEVRIDNHIVDVTAVKGDQGIAVECQLSSISPDTILDRNRIYKLNGYRCIWVVKFSNNPDVGTRVKLESVHKSISKVVMPCILGYFDNGTDVRKSIWGLTLESRKGKHGWTEVVNAHDMIRRR